MKGTFFCSLLCFLALFALTSCHRLPKAHVPYGNPGGQNFENDQEFVKFYESLKKNKNSNEAVAQ